MLLIRYLCLAVFFLSIRGFTLPDLRPTPVILENFRVFNKVVNAGDSTGLLSQAISDTELINLSYKHTVFAFDFRARGYDAAQRVEYAYKLEGFDKDWNYVGSASTATYTNIGSGDYFFRVRAATAPGLWSNNWTEVKISVSAPPWATVWAYFCYFLIVVGVVFLLVQNLRKRMQLEHQKALNQNLIKSDRLKDRFLANTSHELRGPLNGIVGLAESMLAGSMGQPSDAMSHSLKMIASSGRRLSSLVTDILDHSKLIENKLNLRLEAVDLRGVCTAVMELSAPLIGNKNVRLEHDIPSDAKVLVDENRFQQILYNILGNAIKFTRRGQISVHANRQGALWHIVVRDTGIGMSPEDISTIFDAFSQVNNSENHEDGGAGLGLAICRELVQLHGGRIEVDSQLGVGSEFQIVLPAANPESKPESLEAASSESVNSDLTGLAPSAPLKPTPVRAVSMPSATRADTILVVDGDSVTRLVIASMLSQHGYGVIEASDGAQALEFIRADVNISLVILDVMIPGMSGFELCMRIRTIYSIDQLPVLFLTAKNVQDDVVKGFVSGGNSYLTKPIEKHQLLTRILRHLTALKTHKKLLKQIERSDLSQPYSCLGLDTLDEILQAINGADGGEAILAKVVRLVLNITQGTIACYWIYEPTQGLYRFAGQFDGTGEPANFIVGECDITLGISGLDCEANRFTELADANTGGELTPVLISCAELANAYIMPVRYGGATEGLFIVNYRSCDQRGVAPGRSMVEELNRIRAHIVAAVVKTLSSEPLCSGTPTYQEPDQNSPAR